MANDYSFDVVSKVDLNLVSECIQVALKEIVNRFDFKGTNSNIELDPKALEIIIQSSDEYKVGAVYDVLCMRMAKRCMPLKNFEPQKIEAALGGTARQKVKIISGIPSDKAREIVAAVKKAGLKAQVAIQGDQVRVSSRSKDVLQEAISFLKGQDFKLQLQFENYR
ncbi:MAG: YajQ family cyclic di-GMP-binding protein [Elusimicrobia bacterium GWA2_69_24]|nr:MAG: YajQ family cyclic di-GMP-binding protein [Elusimicrobia bacterium GWA2_69_24]HBL18941.1 YajQ family cyclic di-GMP-binding protein [Elusimicrobiota bacterium]